MEMRLFILLITSLMLLAAPRTASAAKWNFFLPDTENQKIVELFLTRPTPAVESVELSPSEPQADMETEITVQAAKMPASADDEVFTGQVFFSADAGATWDSIELENENGPVWKGVFPPQTSGAEIIYSVQLTTLSGNSYIEAACPADADAVSEMAQAEPECISADDPGQCGFNSPAGCLFPLSADGDESDDESSDVPDKFDVWDIRAGRDDETTYLLATIQGDIGDMSDSRPPASPFYTVGFSLPGVSSCTSEGLLSATCGGIAGYLPQGNIKCSFDKLEGQEATNNADALSCSASKNRLLFSIKNSAFPDGTQELDIVMFDSLVADANRARDYNFGTRIDKIEKERNNPSWPSMTITTCTQTGPNTIGNCTTDERIFVGTTPAPDRVEADNDTYPIDTPGYLYDNSRFTKIRFTTRSFVVQ